jgi:hypothetical protein
MNFKKTLNFSRNLILLLGAVILGSSTNTFSIRGNAGGTASRFFVGSNGYHRHFGNLGDFGNLEDLGNSARQRNQRGGQRSGQSAGQMAGRSPVVLAVKFVEYLDAKGNPVLSPGQVNRLVGQINEEYSQCGMTVKLEGYEVADPARDHLPYSLRSVSQIDPVRAVYDDPKYLVIVNTGPWDHGSMGAPNAWTAMPGDAHAGAVIEGPVATNAPIVAHELGHYLGLNHSSIEHDMMNPVIYSNSTVISSDECKVMVETATAARPKAVRDVLRDTA